MSASFPHDVLHLGILCSITSGQVLVHHLVNMEIAYLWGKKSPINFSRQLNGL